MADKYVDFSATNDGDGTTHSQAASGGAAGAFNKLDAKTFAAADKVWIRRATFAEIAATWTIPSGNDAVIFIGWPKSGDEYYTTRPAGAQGSWDGDSPDYPIINNSSGAHKVIIAAVNSIFHRLQISQSAASSRGFEVTGPGNTFNDCRSVNTGTSGNCEAWLIDGDDNSLYRCYGEGRGGTVTKTSNYSGVFYVTANNTYFFRCQAKMTFNDIVSVGFYLISGNNVTLIDCETIPASNLGTGLFLSSSIRFVKWTGGKIKAKVGIHMDTGTVVATTDLINNVELDCQSLQILRRSFAFICIRKWVQSSTTTYALVWEPNTNSGGGGILVLNDATFAATNSSADLKVHPSVLILARGCLFRTNPINSNASNFELPLGIHSSDHNQTLNDYKIIQQSATLTKTTDVIRSGGDTFTMKFEPTAKTYLPMFLGIPGFETMWATLLSGSNTVTIYGAFKTYADLKKHEVWAELDYLDQGSGSSRLTATSRVTSELTSVDSDASSWAGDTVTGFKLVITVTTGQTCVVPIRLGFGKYVSGGIVYIDPKPVVTQ